MRTQAQGNEQLAAILAACTSHDNHIRRAGEEALKQASRDPDYILCLLEVVKMPHDLQVRQLSMTQLRKQIIARPAALGQQGRLLLKSSLQQVLLHDDEASSIRKMGGEALAAAAKYALPAGEWPDLLPWLQTASKSSNERHRELAITVLGSLVAYLGVHMQQHFVALMEILHTGLNDPSAKVQRVALVAVGVVVNWVTDGSYVSIFHKLLPPILQLAQRGVASGDVETLVETLRTITDLLENPLPLLSSHLPQLVPWCMQIASTAEQPLVIRQTSLQVIEALACNKPKQLVKTGLVKPTVAALANMCAEPTPNGYPEDTDELPSNKLASQVLNVLAKELPSAHVFQDALQFAQQHIGSSETNNRRAACTVLLVVAEGCSKLMRKSLQPVLKVVAAGIQDPEAEVRAAAAFALAELAEHCLPEILQQAREVLPAIFAVLADHDPTVHEQACYALQAFCENLESDVVEYLDQLMTRLGQVLQHSNAEIKKTALDAIASVAIAAGPAIQPYLQELLPVLQLYMASTEGHLLSCRSAATRCLGLLCEAVGLTAVEPALPGLIAAAFQGFQLGDSELREYTHGMLSSAAKIMGAGFAPWLPAAVEAALKSCALDDGCNGTLEKEDSEPSSGSVSLQSQAESDSELGEEERRFSIYTAILDEKTAAILALGRYAEHLPFAFPPFLEQTLACVLWMADYSHDAVRDEAYTALASLLKACAPTPEGGAPPQMQHLADKSLPILLEAIAGDESKEAVASAVAAVAEFVASGACQARLQDVSAAAINILKGEAICQEVASDCEEWEDSESAEDNGDELLFEAVAGLLPVLAKAAGQAFCSAWKTEYWSLVLECMKASRPSGVQAAMMGMTADIVGEIGASGVNLEKLIPILQRELRSDESINRQNAAFCVGMVAQASPVVIEKYKFTILQALHPLLSNAEDPAVHDNTLGAIARIIASSDIAGFPLEEVWPLFLNSLPIKNDFEEAEAVYGCLCTLAYSPDTRQRVLHTWPQAMTALRHAAVQEGVPTRVKEKIVQTLASF